MDMGASVEGKRGGDPEMVNRRRDFQNDAMPNAALHELHAQNTVPGNVMQKRVSKRKSRAILKASQVFVNTCISVLRSLCKEGKNHVSRSHSSESGYDNRDPHAHFQILKVFVCFLLGSMLVILC